MQTVNPKNLERINLRMWKQPTRKPTQQQHVKEFSEIHHLHQSRYIDLVNILADINDRLQQNENPAFLLLKETLEKIVNAKYCDLMQICQNSLFTLQKITASIQNDQKSIEIAHDVLCIVLEIFQISPRDTTKINNYLKSNGPKSPRKKNRMSLNPTMSAELVNFTGNLQDYPFIANDTNCLDLSPAKNQKIPLSVGKLYSQSMCSLFENKNISKPNKKKKQVSSPIASGNETDEENDLVVCRICDEKVPIDLIEEHTKSCINAYKNASLVATVDEQMKQIEENSYTEYMNVKWPGPPRIAIYTLIPLLKISSYIKQALHINVNITDSSEELSVIKKRLNVLINNCSITPTVLTIARTILQLLKKKITSSNAILKSEEILRQTTVSGNSGNIQASTNRLATQISDFDFIKRISAGAYARVFLGKKKKTGDIFAIKVIPKDSLKQKNQVRRVLAEKDILLQFCNPYIVNFYYSIIGKHNLYLVMEFLPGGDLYSLLQKLGSLEEKTTKIYILQILNALKYLHSNGIIHRDLKPDNVLISADGTLKLTDFGLSYIGMVDRQISPDASLVNSKSLVGTPDYVAPEIILRGHHSFPCDYWSLGVILYEMLVGEPPFHGGDEDETYDNILRGKIYFDPEDDLSEDAQDLIKKLLILNPDDRLGSKSIDDIISHPFLAGIDLEKEEAPFVPQLDSAEDTEYFEARYHFDTNDDSDILKDIDEATIKGVVNTTKVLNNFESVSLISLAKVTQDVANRRRRSTGCINIPVNLQKPHLNLSTDATQPTTTSHIPSMPRPASQIPVCQRSTSQRSFVQMPSIPPGSKPQDSILSQFPKIGE